MEAAYFMRAAYQEAMKAFDEGEVPVGAVITKAGVIIGKGYNRMEQLHDATAHAEIIAISAASSRLSTWHLDGCTIYVTIEPCLMCLGAIVHSRIASIVYGAADPREGAVDSFFHRQEVERAFHYFPEVQSGIMAGDCALLLSSFFAKARTKNRSTE